MSIIVDMNLFMQSRIVGTNLFVRINPFVHMVKHRQVCAYRLKKRRKAKNNIVGTNLFVQIASHRQVCAYRLKKTTQSKKQYCRHELVRAH